MSIVAPPTIPELIHKTIEGAARRIVDAKGHLSPEGTRFTLCVDLDGDSVTATTSDDRVIQVAPRVQPGHFIFKDGVELDAKYSLVEEEVLGIAVTRRSVPHFHLTSLDYLTLEMANDLVRNTIS